MLIWLSCYCCKVSYDLLLHRIRKKKLENNKFQIYSMFRLKLELAEKIPQLLFPNLPFPQHHTLSVEGFVLR